MKTHTITFKLIALAFIALVAVLLFKPFYKAESSTFPGLRGFSQFATTSAIGFSAVPAITMFNSNETCNSRVITTRGDTGIMIAFSDPTLIKQTAGEIGSTTLSGAKGFWQAPSTTVAYDAGIYGCGRWTGFAGVSTTISVQEF